MRKWIAGLFGTVLAGAILWLLTNGLFPSLFQRPHLVFTVSQVHSPASVGAWTAGTFTIVNDGKATAKNCVMEWRTGSLQGDLRETGFSLTQGETHSWNTNVQYPKPGEYRTTLTATCATCEQVSETHIIKVSPINPGAIVDPRGNRN